MNEICKDTLKQKTPLHVKQQKEGDSHHKVP